MMPNSPCPDIVDLLRDSMQRNKLDVMDMADREVCLIGWVEKFKKVDIWK